MVCTCVSFVIRITNIIMSITISMSIRISIRVSITLVSYSSNNDDYCHYYVLLSFV